MPTRNGARPEPPAAATRSAAGFGPVPRKTILCADDDPRVLLLLRLTLEQRGYRVLCACDGAAALEAARAHRPDAILLDVEMPHVHGVDACRLLKADPATSHIPVIMLTARAQDADRERGAAAGADGYVTKPFSPRALADLLRRHLNAEEA